MWTINRSHSQDSALDFGLSTPPTKKMPSFQLSRNTSMTTTTMTPTQSTSSLSVISSVVGSSLTTGLMEQVSTWRTDADTDDDDASLEIYSSPSMNRPSFPSQNSQEESGGSILNGMEIMPTLQLRFPQLPLEQPDDSDIMPPPSSTSSMYRRHSTSSQYRPVFNRVKRPSQDDNAGDQFVPSTGRSSHHALAAEILSRSVRESRSKDQSPTPTLMNKSGFPSPQSSTPSPRIPTVHNFIQSVPSAPMASSPRGESESFHRRSPSQSGQLRLSPNLMENSRRSLGRRSMDDIVQDEDEPMVRESPRLYQAPSPRFAKEDPRLRDLGATLQKSLSFNGDDELQEALREDERPLNPGRAPVRHHPYMARSRPESSSQRVQSERPQQRPPTLAETFIRDRRERNRQTEREEDREIMGKTPLLLNAINTSMTNILSEIQTAQRQNQGEIAHFREELYPSLQVAFTRLADQIEGVGRAVVSAENANRENRELIQQLAQSIGAALGEGFSNLAESIQQQLQQQIQLQIQQNMQEAVQPYRSSSRPSSIVGPSNVSGSTSFSGLGMFGSGTSNSRQGFGSSFGGRDNGSSSNSGGSWRRRSNPPEDYNEHDDDDEDHGRGKRRAVERPRSTSGSRKTIDRPRKVFEN
ncbi:hypothetical protein BGX34_001772 [Mortierella sp. NVP85]|nr:hypothetical protein BGX34_001772 [Mortierella sp. NVP85]